MVASRIRWNEPIWNRTQAVILWMLGAAGVINELFLRPEPRPITYPLIAGLLGFPFARAFDMARQDKAELDTRAVPEQEPPT